MKITESLLPWMFKVGIKNRGQIPLALSNRGKIVCFVASILFSALLGNMFLQWNLIRSKISLNKIKVQLPPQAESSVEKIIYLLPDYKNQLLSGLGSKGEKELDTLFYSNTITYQSVLNYLNQKLGIAKDELEEDIHGTLKWIPFSVFRRSKITDLLKKYGFTYKPNSSNKLNEDELDFFITAKLISLIRTKHKNLNGINLPYWSVVAFADWIQWIILFVASFVVLLLILKKQWIEFQSKLISKGSLLRNSNKNIWDIEQSDHLKLPYFNQLSVKYPSLILPVNLIEQVLRMKNEENKPTLESFIKEQVAMMSFEADEGYHLENTGWDFAPSAGFVGTIIGAVLCFSQASGLLNESEPLFQSFEMNTLTGSLSISFFTTLVGLLASLVISFFYARTKTAEAKVFDQLSSTAVKKLKKYWDEK